MRAVCYARVSSAAQRDRDTIASQLRVLPEFIARMGWTLAAPARTYVDDGRTAKAGHLDARSGLAALLRDASNGTFDVVVVVDVDRLTRSEDLQERGEILGTFQRAKIKLASSTSGQVLDLSTSTGDLFTSLHAFFAAEWTRKHRERVTQGRLTGIGRGHKPAGRIAFGLAWSKDLRQWSIDPLRGPVVREIYERLAAGESCRTIADELHKMNAPRTYLGSPWAPYQVARIARSRHTVGELTGDRKRKLIIQVPPIVDEDLWQRAQVQVQAGRFRGLRRTRHEYLLEGLGGCAHCGSPVYIRSSVWDKRRKGRTQPSAYYCKGRRLFRRDNGPCPSPIINTAEADAAVWTAIVRELDDPDLAMRIERDLRGRAGEHESWESDAAGYRSHLARLERVEETVIDRHHRNLISESVFDRELGRISRERIAVQQQLASAESAMQATRTTAVRLDDVRRTLADLRAALDAVDFATRRRLVQLLIPKRGFELLDESTMRLTLLVPRSAQSSLDNVEHVGNTTLHETPLRVRVLARVPSPSKICAHCDKPLTAEQSAHPTRIYCSDVCLYAAYRKRKAVAR